MVACRRVNFKVANGLTIYAGLGSFLRRYWHPNVDRRLIERFMLAYLHFIHLKRGCPSRAYSEAPLKEAIST